MGFEAGRVDVRHVMAEHFQPMALRVRARCGKVQSVRHPRITRIERSRPCIHTSDRFAGSIRKVKVGCRHSYNVGTAFDFDSYFELS